MPGNSGGHCPGLDLLAIKYRSDRPSDERRVHNGPIDHGILGQRFQAEAHQLVTLLGTLQLDGLD